MDFVLLLLTEVFFVLLQVQFPVGLLNDWEDVVEAGFRVGRDIFLEGLVELDDGFEYFGVVWQLG